MRVGSDYRIGKVRGDFTHLARKLRWEEEGAYFMIPLKQNEPNHLCSMCAKMAHIINKSWDNLSHMVCIV